MIDVTSMHAEFPGDSFRCLIHGVDDCNQLGAADNVTCIVATRHGGFGGVTAALLRSDDVIADLEFGCAIHVLPGEAAVADELPVTRLDDPQAVAVFRVVLFVPGDPSGCLFTSFLNRPGSGGGSDSTGG